jgi:hypothetical protein
VSRPGRGNVVRAWLMIAALFASGVALLVLAAFLALRWF